MDIIMKNMNRNYKNNNLIRLWIIIQQVSLLSYRYAP